MRSQYMFYAKDSSSVDILDEFAFEEMEHSFLVPDSWVVRLKPKLQQFYDQRFLTKWVVGAKSTLTNNYQEFHDILRAKVLEYRKPPVKEIKKSLLQKLKWDEKTTTQQINQKQTELINKMLWTLTDSQIQEIYGKKEEVLPYPKAEILWQTENIEV